VEAVEERFLLSGATGSLGGTYVGAAFEPYIKQWISQGGKNINPAWNSYTTGNDSVANQIAFLAPKFNSLATYGSGWGPYYPVNQPLNNLDSNSLVALEAANYNKAHGALDLTVSQGIFQQGSTAGWGAEISDAIAEVKQANAIYAGTVNRLIFTNEYVTDAQTTNQVINLIQQYKSQIPAGVQVGVRSNTFGQLGPGGKPADFVAALKTLVSNVDFIMVNIYPSPNIMQRVIAAGSNAPALKAAIDAGVQEVITEYQTLKSEAQAVNPNVQVIIGETGWPSYGIAFNDSTGKSSKWSNEWSFFQDFTAKANALQIPSYYFEAIDEPGKSNRNLPRSAPKQWQGYYGAEGHLGLFWYNASDNSGQILPKTNSEPPPPMASLKRFRFASRHNRLVRG
jgi:exo-beta-1,3-glucanase (GH17 family)